MGASTETEKLTAEDLVARLKKKLVAERKRRAKFEQQLKTGAGASFVRAGRVCVFAAWLGAKKNGVWWAGAATRTKRRKPMGEDMVYCHMSSL